MRRRVLVIPKGYIGDIVLTSPVFEALKRDAPDTHVAVLIAPQVADFVRRDVYVDEVIEFDRRGVFSGWNGLRRLARQLGDMQFDAAYAMQRSPRTALLLRLAQIKSRVGYADAMLAPLFTRRVRAVRRHHEVVRNLELVKADLGVSVQQEIDALTKEGPTLVSNLFSLRVPAVSLEEVSASVGGYLGIQTPFVVLSPGSAWETKRWRAEGFRRVAVALVQRGYRVVVVGSPDDSDACSDVCRSQSIADGMIVNMCGRTSLLELIYLIKNSAAVICNDSLALHIASATKVVTVAIFCATSPLFGFGPWKNRAVVVERNELFCKPCRRHGSRKCPTGTYACMDGVSAEQVIRTFDELVLQDSKRRAAGALHVV